ncbi:hypothetical protein Bhyg_13175 [Pseudolycoriella hygida]|uniref:Uncharacterized protein n=1 Tax=Pseudolycoriella hygida TaxID=35572 RepID=A0A9Q0RUG1_9DIPT|nr:hypothetical protein Bhyg_13175 [Pseudolycoriella hygida]
MDAKIARTMRAKRLQTRQQNDDASATKKCRSKSLSVKRNASSSRDTSPPKSVRRVQDKVDSEKKTPTKKLMTKTKKEITSTESKPGNKDETKESQQHMVPQSGIDSLKSNKKTTKNIVDEQKKKDSLKASSGKLKLPTKKETTKQGIKKPDDRVKCNKDEKVSKELKNLGIQISDQSPSSNDKIIKASISEIVKTKYRTSASHSLYGKTPIGIEKATSSKTIECTKENIKDTVIKVESNNTADEKKETKTEVKDDKDVKAIRPVKKESTKETKKEEASDFDAANASEKKQQPAKNKKVGTEHKDLATKFDSKTKEDKKEFSVTKSNCQDISKDKKLKKNDSSEQKKKTKKVENEAEQPSHSSIKEDSKKAKSPKVTKSKKETEDNLDKSSKIKEIKAINQIVEKVNVVQPNDLNTVDINDESKKSITSTENKTQTSKKSKSDENVKKSQNDFNSSSSKKFEDDVDKKAAKKDNNDFKNIDTESNSKLPKKKSKSPKKSASGGTESKDTKESKESSLASIVQTIEEVIAQAVYESVLMEQFKVDSEKHVKSKPSKIPKIKKTENVKTNENPVKRKYVKKKIKVEGHETQETISKPNEQEEPKIEPSAISKPIDKKENEKVNPKKKSAIPKKKGKLTLNEPRKTEGDDKLECRTSSSTKNQSKSATDVITKQSTSETSNKAKETIDNSAVKTKTNLLADEPTTSNKFTDDTIPVKESSDSQLKLTEITIYETEKNQLNSKIAPANISYNLEHIDEGTTSERIDNISSFIESPKFISEDSDDDEDFFINLPANLTSATFSGLNIDKPIKEANQSGAKVPTNVQIQPASNNIDDDSNESSTASSDESIVDKRRKKKPVKQSMAKKKAAEKAAKKNTVIGKPAKTSKASMKSQAKELAEKPDPLPMKSKISVKSLESMKNPTVEEKQIKVEILSDDEECCRILENVMNQPSTSSSQIPKNPPSKEPPTKRKYVRKKPLKSDQNKNKNDDNNDATKKDVYDFHESGHSSEDTCLSYKKNSKNDKDSEKKKSERIDRPASSKKVTLVKKKVLSKKDDQTDDEQKMRTTKNDQRTKPSKTPKAKSTQQKRKSSLNHSGSSDSDSDDKVLSKKFSKKKKIFSDSASRSSSVSESSDSEHEVTSSGGKNPRKKLIDSFIGPKRHRIASLNALAKVQCLYENESRTAQELGFVKEPRTLPKEKPIVLLTSEEDNEKIKSESLGQSAPTKKDKEVKKEKKSTQEQPENKNEKQPKQPKQRDKNEDENDEEQEEEEEVVIRTLRAAPGLRGAGKLWEVSMSSMESNSDVDSDESYEDNKADKTKSKKKPLPKRTSVKSSQKTPIVKSKSKTVKAKASTKRLLSSCNSDSSEDESEPTPSSSKKHSKKKRKKSPHDGKSDFKELVVRKRMASLNASAMLAATYEVERHLDRCDSMYYGSSAESDTIVTPKKIKDIKREIEEPKEVAFGFKISVKFTENITHLQPRPVSTNVVIVKDTDVTITGVYVNSSLGSSQEAYCKMQYRVQSSVTEERLLRPTTQDPPKSYTPLSALSCMLPPGSADSIGIETQPSTLQHQPQYHHGPPHQIPLSHHLQSHHQSPDCETPSPFRYQNVYQQSPPSQMQSSSAFCAIPQPDATVSKGYELKYHIITF